VSRRFRQGVRILADTLRQSEVPRPIKVLVELGVAGGRTGCRSHEQARAVARAVQHIPTLRLAGVEGYEGAIDGASFEEHMEGVDRFLEQMRAVTSAFAQAGIFAGLDEIVVSAGGCFFFDRVVAHLTLPWNLPLPVRVVLRSGAYITSDDDMYGRYSPLAGRAAGGDTLQQALELWAVILSRPEPGRAIAGFGKRDAPYDVRLPRPTHRWRHGRSQVLGDAVHVARLNDHHAFLDVEPDVDLVPGDLITCALAHPCTSFDKWPLIPLVDQGYNVIGAIKTYF
jgi:D-serine dehydratase